jgi:hypothetical protein
MTCIALITLIAAMSLWCISPSMAEVGVTDACQDDVRELEDKIKDNKDDYTAESRRKAKTQASSKEIQYTTDGLRVVLVFGDRPASLATIHFFNWERIVDYR